MSGHYDCSSLRDHASLSQYELEMGGLKHLSSIMILPNQLILGIAAIGMQNTKLN